MGKVCLTAQRSDLDWLSFLSAVSQCVHKLCVDNSINLLAEDSTGNWILRGSWIKVWWFCMDWCVFVCCGGEVWRWGWGWGVSHCSTVQHVRHNPPSGASGNVWWWCFLLIQIYTAHTCVCVCLCLFLVVVMSGYLITGSVERWHKDFFQNIHSHCTTCCLWFSAPCNQCSSTRCSFTATLDLTSTVSLSNSKDHSWYNSTSTLNSSVTSIAIISLSSCPARPSRTSMTSSWSATAPLLTPYRMLSLDPHSSLSTLSKQTLHLQCSFSAGSHTTAHWPSPSSQPSFNHSRKFILFVWM